MKLFGRSKPPTQVKANPTAGAMLVGLTGGQKERNIQTFYKDGYEQNVIAFRCINELTTALGSVEIEVHKGETVLEKHPALELLRKPNPMQGWAMLVEELFTEYYVTGNLFLTADKPDGPPKEIWAQPAKHMSVVPGPFGLPARYEFNAGSDKRVFPVNQVSGASQCFHFKTFNPDSRFVGMSKLRHVALSIDVHNNGLTWNSALLANGARPSGIIRFKGRPTNDTISFLTEFFKRRFQGARNAGGIPMLTEDAQWESLSETAKDMDFVTTLSKMEKYIASALGVPLPLIDNDAASYNNMEQAKERFWTDTVLPLLNKFLEAFGNWLLPRYGEGLKLAYNEDSIQALEGVRTRRFDRMTKAAGGTILSIDEARESIGYTAKGGTADELLVSSTVVPIDLVSDVPNPQESAGPPNPEDEQGAEEDAQAAAKFLRLLGYGPDEIKALLNGAK